MVNNESALIFQYFDVSLVVVSLDNISKQYGRNS
jgi:hypothetical protein